MLPLLLLLLIMLCLFAGVSTFVSEFVKRKLADPYQHLIHLNIC
jgi:hypothetical protein